MIVYNPSDLKRFRDRENRDTKIKGIIIFITGMIATVDLYFVVYYIKIIMNNL